jgi:hypothetical protein
MVTSKWSPGSIVEFNGLSAVILWKEEPITIHPHQDLRLNWFFFLDTYLCTIVHDELKLNSNRLRYLPIDYLSIRVLCICISSTWPFFGRVQCRCNGLLGSVEVDDGAGGRMCVSKCDDTYVFGKECSASPGFAECRIVEGGEPDCMWVVSDKANDCLSTVVFLLQLERKILAGLFISS